MPLLVAEVTVVGSVLPTLSEPLLIAFITARESNLSSVAQTRRVVTSLCWTCREFDLVYSFHLKDVPIFVTGTEYMISFPIFQLIGRVGSSLERTLLNSVFDCTLCAFDWGGFYRFIVRFPTTTRTASRY